MTVKCCARCVYYCWNMYNNNTIQSSDDDDDNDHLDRTSVRPKLLLGTATADTTATLLRTR